jgi:hypothetical protein
VGTKRYIRESADGRWEVLQEGHLRSNLRADTQRDAVKRARDIIRRSGGGEIRILNRTGKVVHSDTVAKPRAKTNGTKRPGQGRSAS